LVTLKNGYDYKKATVRRENSFSIKETESNLYWNSILLDTNIVLYLLNGEETIIPLLEEKNLFLSFITQLELLGTRNLTAAEHIGVIVFKLAHAPLKNKA
jgi:hypothetical protein